MIWSKTRWGQRPPTGISRLLAEIEGFRGAKWELYELYSDNTKGWIDFKLRLRGKSGGRVNYRLGWNPELDRFAGGRDYMSLKIGAPMLYKRVCEVLKEKSYMREDYEL